MLIWQYDDIPRVGWSEVVREDAHDEGFVGISDGRHAIDERADDGAETSRNPPTSRARLPALHKRERLGRAPNDTCFQPVEHPAGYMVSV